MTKMGWEENFNLEIIVDLFVTLTFHGGAPLKPHLF